MSDVRLRELERLATTGDPGAKTALAEERRRAGIRFVLYHGEHGVFIGAALGFKFWSKADPVGQDCAVTFVDEDDALRFTEEVSFEEGTRPVPVWPDIDGVWASVEACVAAGLPAWEAEWDPEDFRSELPLESFAGAACTDRKLHYVKLTRGPTKNEAKILFRAGVASYWTVKAKAADDGSIALRRQIVAALNRWCIDHGWDGLARPSSRTSRRGRS